ncbi:TraK family protein [Citrobacter sedlakii]|uniref:TraK family protein n=1 Tax=Citrobacter sedlakii TaxID=67826 RepID=UPI003B24B87D
MSDHQNQEAKRHAPRRGRASFLAVLEDVRREHERGVPLTWIFETFEDRLDIGYTQFTKYVTRYIKQSQPVMASYKPRKS